MWKNARKLGSTLILSGSHSQRFGDKHTLGGRRGESLEVVSGGVWGVSLLERGVQDSISPPEFSFCSRTHVLLSYICNAKGKVNQLLYIS